MKAALLTVCFAAWLCPARAATIEDVKRYGESFWFESAWQHSTRVSPIILNEYTPEWKTRRYKTGFLAVP